jgi:hypothetical protein
VSFEAEEEEEEERRRRRRINNKKRSSGWVGNQLLNLLFCLSFVLGFFLPPAPPQLIPTEVCLLWFSSFRGTKAYLFFCFRDIKIIVFLRVGSPRANISFSNDGYSFSALQTVGIQLRDHCLRSEGFVFIFEERRSRRRRRRRH